MSQGLRDMLANRRFAIPLIILLAFCFIGLILVGIVLILRPGSQDGDQTVGQITQATDTPTLEPTELPTSTPEPTETPTPEPSPTLVPVGTPVDSESGEAASAGTPVDSAAGEATPESTTAATAEPTSTAETTGATATVVQQPTTAPQPEEEELAQTGVGWGLVLFSAVGLALLAIVARRLRLTS